MNGVATLNPQRLKDKLRVQSALRVNRRVEIGVVGRVPSCQAPLLEEPVRSDLIYELSQNLVLAEFRAPPGLHQEPVSAAVGHRVHRDLDALAQQLERPAVHLSPESCGDRCNSVGYNRRRAQRVER